MNDNSCISGSVKQAICTERPFYLHEDGKICYNNEVVLKKFRPNIFGNASEVRIESEEGAVIVDILNLAYQKGYEKDRFVTF
jgi:hypothetical protein